MPKKAEVEKLQHHYKKPEPELILAFYRCDDARRYLKEGSIKEARELMGHIKHYVKDALDMLGVTEAELKA